MNLTNFSYPLLKYFDLNLTLIIFAAIAAVSLMAEPFCGVR